MCETSFTHNTVNAVERVSWYADKTTLPQEKPHTITSTQPSPAWPEQGRICFENVSMAYRLGLPPVLKDM